MANDYVGFSNKETTFGVRNGSPTWEWCSALSESMRSTRQYEVENSMFYSVPRAADMVTGRFQTAGSIRWQVGPENGIGRALESLFGTTTGVVFGGAANDFTWTDVTGSVQSPPSLTVATSRAYQLAQFDYLGQTVNKLSLEGVPNQSIRAEVGFVGDFEAINPTPDTPSIPTQETFAAHESDWLTEPSGGGTAVSELGVEGWSLNIEREIEVSPSVSQIRGRKNYGGTWSITGHVDIGFDSLLYYRRAMYGTDTGNTPLDEVTLRNVKIQIIGNQTVGTSTYRLMIDMPKVVLETAEANQTGRDRVVGGYPFRAYSDPAAGYAIQFILRNSRAVTFYQ